MPNSNQLLTQINMAVETRDPYRFAAALQSLVAEYRAWAAGENWPAFRPLADALDDLLAARKPELVDDAALSSLLTLTRQVCVVLALMGDAAGDRDTGYFRASMFHARRLDAMTEGKLQLVDLVDLVGR